MPGDGAVEPLLRAERVSKVFDGLWAVRDVSLAVRRGEVVGLIGPNGAGKTTLFHVLSRFLPADGGEIWFNGRRIDRLPPYMVPRLGLVRTFQICRVFSRMTVLENLKFAAPDQVGEGLWSSFLRWRRVRQQEAEITRRADELIDYFKLGPVRDAYAGALSGGQRKLLEMARALMTRPAMLLLDEPMAGVNPVLKEQLLGYILDLCRQGITLLVVEHDIDLIMRISNRILVMASGRVIAEGEPDEVRRDPRVVDAYLGERIHDPY